MVAQEAAIAMTMMASIAVLIMSIGAKEVHVPYPTERRSSPELRARCTVNHSAVTYEGHGTSGIPERMEDWTKEGWVSPSSPETNLFGQATVSKTSLLPVSTRDDEV
jgi:hypothetical protein